MRKGVTYGANRVRIRVPIRVDARIRARFKLMFPEPILTAYR